MSGMNTELVELSAVVIEFLWSSNQIIMNIVFFLFQNWTETSVIGIHAGPLERVMLFDENYQVYFILFKFNTKKY